MTSSDFGSSWDFRSIAFPSKKFSKGVEFQAIPSVIGGEHGELTAVSPKNSPNEKVFPALQKNWFKIEYGASTVSRLTVPRDDSSMRLHNKKTRTRTEKLKLHTQLRKYMSMDIP